MRVKICGVNTPAAFDAAAEAGADWVGLVFAANSPRLVTPAQAAGLSKRMAGGPALVGLLVDPTDDDVARVLGAVPVSALQIYAAPPRTRAIAETSGVPVWRAMAVDSASELGRAERGIAALVVEPPAPPGAKRPGGNGVALDWRVLSGWRPGVPWLLAGGLDSGNVAHAIAQSGAEAVDVSSGVETSPGVKDPGLIRSFVAAAKSLLF